MWLSIYRGASVNLNVHLDDSSEISQELNGKDVATIKFYSPSSVDLLIGDHVVLSGKRYVLNVLPEITKTGNSQYEYNCVFEGRMYELSKILYSDGINSEFFLTGDLEFFVDLIITNLNRVQSGWSKGTIQASTETKNLQFSNENCLEVLQRLCEEYELEFKVNEDKSIDVGEFGAVIAHTFAYGKGNGLYSLTRKTVDSKNIVTRLYPYGADRNIPANYRGYSTRLKLSTNYIEQNVATYGVIEAAKIFEDIYPRFNGAITALGATTNVFRCSTIDFDLNNYLVAGTSAKVHFNTGALAGYEFEISSYKHATKEITLKFSQQEKVYSDSGLSEFILPNDTIKPAAGDEFVFIDITMPDSYITAAEAELLSAGTTYLTQNSTPRVNYSLEIDPKYIIDNSISIEKGDYLHIEDAELNIDRDIRVVNIIKSIYEPVTWRVELSDTVAPQIINRVLAELEDVRRLIVVNKLSDVARAKRNWKTAEDVRNSIFDPDGYFDPENIKPLSIETSMLTVGTRAGNFTLSSTIEPNYGRDASRVRLGAGTLVHFQIDTTIKTWTITENIVTGLVAGTTYYIYARCNRATSAGILLADTVQRKVDSDATYYYFPVGILTSVIDGWRDAIMTYGQSYMVGRMLNVGQITGASGLLIDLDTGDIQGRITFSDGRTEEDFVDATVTPVEQSQIISHYSFDEVTGSMLYDNKKAYNGQTYNTRTFEDGVMGKCLITGTNNVYGRVDNFQITQSFSVAMWINGQATWNVTGDILNASEANGFRISTVTGTRQIIFRVRSSSNTETTLTTYTPSDIDSWHHVSFAYNGTTGAWVIYWDGEPVASGTNLVTRLASDTITIYIGRSATPTYLINRVDELYICNVVLDAKQIKFLYQYRDALGKDRVQTTIEGGLISTGRIEVGPGLLGAGKAGITGDGTATSSIRIWAGATFANRATAPFRVQDDGTAYMEKAVIAEAMIVDNESIYVGTKSIANGFAAAGFTIGANGSIHTPRFYLNPDGSVGLRSNTTGKRVEINSIQNAIFLYNSSNVNVIKIDDNMAGAGQPGIAVYDPSTPTQDYSMLTTTGLFSYRNTGALDVAVTAIDSETEVIFKRLPTGGSHLKVVYVDYTTGKMYRAT